MIFSINSLFLLCVQVAGVALALIVLGWISIVVAKITNKKKISLREGGPLTKFGMICILLSIVILAIVFMGFIALGIWWLWVSFSDQLTPTNLALFSIVLGPAPLLLTLTSIIVAKLLGGEVDASQVRNCVLFGIDIGGFLHAFYMSYILVVFTGGLAIMGLVSSGVWVLFRTWF